MGRDSKISTIDISDFSKIVAMQEGYLARTRFPSLPLKPKDEDCLKVYSYIQSAVTIDG